MNASAGSNFSFTLTVFVDGSNLILFSREALDDTTACFRCNSIFEGEKMIGGGKRKICQLIFSFRTYHVVNRDNVRS
jgi:hypothetical protein